MIKGKIHHGKVILFGEYSVIHSGEALAMPLLNIFGHLTDKPPYHPQSGKYIKAFFQYISEITLPHNVRIDLNRWQQDLGEGLYMNTNAIIGYGAGSSGILTAAIFRRYSKLQKKLSLLQLREVLASMESYFHGNSSGIDPLISFMNQPIWMKGSDIELLDGLNKELLQRFYLYDTGIPRSTEPLVKWYKSQMTDEIFAEAMTQMSVLVNQLINSLLIDDIEDLTLFMKQLSAHQLIHLERLIPESIKILWEEGLENDDYYIKLCGAGGGGYMLIYKINALPESELPILSII
jgi:mevalonate kinase